MMAIIPDGVSIEVKVVFEDDEMIPAFLAGEISLTFCNHCFSNVCPTLKNSAAMCPGPAP